MTFKYLDERLAYEDRYDRATVEECRWFEDHLLAKMQEQRQEGKALPEWVMPLQLFTITGDRWRNREEWINECMERDRQRDELISRARPPLIRCPSCGRAMDCIHTSLNFATEDGERDRVEFFLCCKPCKQGKHVYQDGREIVRKPLLCEKCSHEVESETKEKKGKRYYVRNCKHCGHKEEILSVLDEEEKVPTEEEIARFEHDKKRFCITDSQGQRFLHWKEGIKKLEGDKKEYEINVEYHDKLAEVKKLNIAGLEKILKTAIKKAGYADLQISMPPPDRQIIMNFSVRDMDEKRKDHDSQKTLEKAIEKVLEDTNWALMSEGVSYRLGLLSGRIRGYESEEDLQELTKSRVKKIGKKQKVASDLSTPKKFSY